MVTMQDARRVARLLYRNPSVQAVEIFGSVARVRRGQDLDLIVVTDRNTALKFLKSLDSSIGQEWEYWGRRGGYSGRRKVGPFVTAVAETLKQWRLTQAQKLLGWRFRLFLWRVRWLLGAGSLDILIFPPEWRNDEDVAKRMISPDEQFMTDIAREAVRIA